ncbi:MAG: hypothetical protein KAR79_01920 [Simkaniaceae bacterium]|nr:hypothetical protein [Simkaniaceae bacterium]
MADKKEGMTVQELENFGKKYGFEIAFLLFFILASLFSFVFFGAAWSIYLAGIGGALGIWLPAKVEKFLKTAFQFAFKQEKITQIILAVVGVILSFFVPPLVFFMLGLAGGSGLHKCAMKTSD